MHTVSDAAIETRLQIPSEADVTLMQKNNCLLNVLGEEGGGNIVVCGDTSVGKSTVNNFLLGFPLNLEGQGVTTRRPCIISQVRDTLAEIPIFRVSFEGRKFETNSIEETARFIADLNPADTDGFQSEPVHVEMRHESFNMGRRLVDLPGLVHPMQPHAEQVKQLAMRYMKPDNIIILVLSMENWANGGAYQLLQSIKNYPRVIIVQNFAYVDWNEGRGQHRLKEVRKQVGSSFDFVLVDFGAPFDPSIKKSDDTMYRQQNWLAMVQSQKPAEVTKSMWKHADLHRQRIRDKFESDIDQYKVRVGLTYLQNRLTRFALQNLAPTNARLMNDISDKLKAKATRIQELKVDLGNLEDDLLPEWQELLDGIASNFAMYFDTRIQQADLAVGSDRGEQKSLMKTEKEVPLAHVEPWFSRSFDATMLKLLDAASNEFEPQKDVACLKSWRRLLDEFTGALCFAPMKKLSRLDIENLLHQFNNSGPVFERTIEDGLLTKLQQQICIDELLHKFQQRLEFLVLRDISDAMKILEADRGGYFAKLERVLPGEDEKWRSTKKRLLETVHKVMVNHVKETLRKDISEMCRRTRDDAGPLHWLQPFNKIYLNGQIPWKFLGADERPLRAVRPLPESISGQKNGILKVDREDHLNCTNYMNLTMFQLATELYCPPIVKSSGENAELESYAIGVLKLLQTMRGEMATFIDSRSKDLVRSMCNIRGLLDNVRGTIQSASDQTRAALHLPVIGTEPLMMIVEKMLTSVFHDDGILSHTNDAGWTSSQELLAAKEYTAPSGAVEQGGDVCWLGVPEEKHNDWLERDIKLAAHDQPLFGKAAWTRLNQEFVQSVWLLSARAVDPSELTMAKVSVGRLLQAGDHEIIEKLTNHRLEQIFSTSAEVFHHRMLTIFARDMQTALSQWTKSAEPGVHSITSALGVDVPSSEIAQALQDWLLQQDSPLYAHAHRELEKFKRSIADRSEELFPFDFTTLNGRFPIKNMLGKTDSSEKVEELLASNLLNAETMEAMRDGIERDGGMSGGAASAALKVKSAILKAARANLENSCPPPDTRDHKELNEWALLYFKAIQAAAVDYCRPKLTKMMARLYQPEELRRALFLSRGAHSLSFWTFFGDFRNDKERELRRCEDAYKRMEQEFEFAKKGLILEGSCSSQPEIQEMELSRFEKLRKVRKACEIDLEKKRQELAASSQELSAKSDEKVRLQEEIKRMQDTIGEMRTMEFEMEKKERELEDYKSQEKTTKRILLQICREVGVEDMIEEDVTADQCLLEVRESRKCCGTFIQYCRAMVQHLHMPRLKTKQETAFPESPSSGSPTFGL
jgi:hypothetical protein